MAEKEAAKEADIRTKKMTNSASAIIDIVKEHPPRDAANILCTAVVGMTAMCARNPDEYVHLLEVFKKLLDAHKNEDRFNRLIKGATPSKPTLQ